jgi:hypothetical protein
MVLRFRITVVRSLNPKRSFALIMFHLALYLCNPYDIYIFIADINRLLCTVNSIVATIYFIMHSLVTAFSIFDPSVHKSSGYVWNCLLW